MKVLLIVCGLVMTLGGVVASCGPQKAYCPNLQNGDCNNVGVATGGNGDGSAGADQGDATIITGTGGM